MDVPPDQFSAPSGRKICWPWTGDTLELPESMPDGRPLPRISIIVPSYNQGKFIGDTIRSILCQGYPDLELIVIDGGSSDDTVDILRKYESYIAYWVSEPDRGQSHALNKGFAKSSGSIMAWICADDMYLPGAFARTAEFFSNNEAAEFIYGDGCFIDEDNKVLNYVSSGPVLNPENFHNYNYVFSTTAFWRRSLWERSGGYIDEMNSWTMDWELFIRMNKCAELHYRPGAVACLRHHADTKTSNGLTARSKERNREIVTISRKYGGWLCYNSMIYILLQITQISDYFRKAPRPIYSLAFWFFHLPIRMSGRRKRSIFFNGYRT